jgi:hypothetical protein
MDAQGDDPHSHSSFIESIGIQVAIVGVCGRSTVVCGVPRAQLVANMAIRLHAPLLTCKFYFMAELTGAHHAATTVRLW